MRAEEIIGLIKREIPFEEESLKNLQALLKEYPYFQAAHLLYTLNLKVLGDSGFPAELRKAAVYLSDRKKLFYLVEDDFFIPDIIGTLEQKDDPQLDSSFDLINLFLNSKNENSTFYSNLTEQALVSEDYISLYLSQETEKGELEVKPMQNQEMIDEFLEKDKKSPVKLDLKQSDETSETFIPNLDEVDEDSFFSETLAKIYLKQKKYDKALKIIRKLDLVYPEKNRYFADQIRFLEKLIINTNKIK